MIIKYDNKNQFDSLINFYEEDGYTNELKHEVRNVGIVYVNEPYNSLHNSSVEYAYLKKYQCLRTKS